MGYRSTVDAAEHVALVRGDLGTGSDVLVRLHSECLTGDVLGSLRCDCGPQLDAALRTVADEGRGVVVYLRGPRGPRHRAAAQAGGVPAAGPRARTPSTPTSTSGCRPTPATSASARRSWPTSACARCGCSPTTRRSARASRSTGCTVRRAGAAAGARDAGEHRLPADQAGPDGPRPARPRSAAGRDPSAAPTLERHAAVSGGAGSPDLRGRRQRAAGRGGRGAVAHQA